MFWLKVAAQIVTVTVGVISVIQAHLVQKAGTDKKKLTVAGYLTLAMLALSFAVFLGTEISQQKSINELHRMNESLLAMRADHPIAGIEISYHPSVEQWSKIAEIYGKIEPPTKGFSYSEAMMRAERDGDRWRIDFGPVTHLEGTVRYPPVIINSDEKEPFEQVLKAATLALWIRWGDSFESEIEPWRRQYCSVIMVSKDLVTLTLEPPFMKLNVNSLLRKPTILLRSRKEPGKALPDTLQFRSLDSVLLLDQKITPDWKKEERALDGDTYIRRTKPFIAGPYTLEVTLSERGTKN